jgi:restriction system protein
MEIAEDLVEVLHPGRKSHTELECRSAWARTYLKNYGLLENSARGVWALTAEGTKTQEVDGQRVVRSVQQQQRQAREAVQEDEAFDDEPEEPTWNERLIEVLLEIQPDAFERLCQRLLREAGFIEVEVTGRSGDGGVRRTRNFADWRPCQFQCPLSEQALSWEHRS